MHFKGPYSEGVRRLSHALGGLGTLLWVILYFYLEVIPIASRTGVNTDDVFIIATVSAVGGVFFYGLAYGAVQLVYWVLQWVWRGFVDGES